MPFIPTNIATQISLRHTGLHLFKPQHNYQNKRLDIIANTSI